MERAEARYCSGRPLRRHLQGVNEMNQKAPFFDAALMSVWTRPENQVKEEMKQQQEISHLPQSLNYPICKKAFSLCVCVCWCHILTNPLSSYPINTPHNWNKSYQYRRWNLNYRMIGPNKVTENFFCCFWPKWEFACLILPSVWSSSLQISLLNTSAGPTHWHAARMQRGHSLNTWNSFSKLCSWCSLDQKLICVAAEMQCKLIQRTHLLKRV